MTDSCNSRYWNVVVIMLKLQSCRCYTQPETVQVWHTLPYFTFTVVVTPLKGIVHPRITILAVFIHPNVILNILCFHKKENQSYRFRMTWGWVYKDNKFSFLGELSLLVSEYSVGVFDVIVWPCSNTFICLALETCRCNEQFLNLTVLV